MKSQWDDDAVREAVSRRGPGVSEILALRTYSARLLGAEPSLVLHGGGNTSVKTKVETVFGETVDVIHVKGSGWDLATIEPPGHPAVRMAPLLRMLDLPVMTDEQMVNELRLALLDAAAPTPSVETLLHAALPAPFIDHTHADAVLSIVDQADARAICEEVFGSSLLFIPYVMPGFGLARTCKDAWDRALKEGRSPTVMVLERHGVFTFGASAKESYTRMIDAVSLAERHVARRAKAPAPKAAPVMLEEVAARAVATVRGAIGRASGASVEQAPIVSLRSSSRILAFLERNDLADLVARGCATPDHVLRTKPWPLVRRGAAYDDTFASELDEAIAAYGRRYDGYFEAAVGSKSVTKTKLDAWPRIVLLQGLGICGIGKTKKDADIAADIYEHTIEVIEGAEAAGAYSPVSEGDVFDVEYWSLEQAKLKKEKPLPLSGRVALVTGAASGIGQATAALFVELGAHVVLCDRDEAGIEAALAALGKAKASQLATAVCDVTRPDDVARAFRLAACRFGGADLVVSNAGSAAQGRLETLEGDAALRASLELNLLSHVNVARSAVEGMQRMGRGGCLLFNASKSAFNQGPGFGPYAVPKAALVSLMRQYAVDLGAAGIRSNAVNADRVRTNIFAGGLVASRAAARGITVDEYFRSNLLSREVTSRHVAEAFAWLAQATATTGCVVTVDGGNAAAFPR